MQNSFERGDTKITYRSFANIVEQMKTLRTIFHRLVGLVKKWRMT